MPNQIVWFDLPVIDLDRAIGFYSAVLGVAVEKKQFSEMAIGVLPHENDEVGGCLHQSDHDKPSDHGALLYFNVQGRLDEAVAAVEAHGGKILQAKHQIGEWGFRALALDTEGNRIALHSM